MSDLIINGIDHSKFEPEWAKRGGVVLTYFCGAKSIQNWTQFGIIGLDSEGIEAAQPHKPNDFKFELIVDQLKLNGGSIRMATPDECAVAGIEYIEPPARWLPIEVFPPPQYTWLGDEQDKPKIISVDDWEDYEIRNNRSIVCNKSGLVVEAYEWFGKWYHLVNDGGDCYQQLINPTHFQYLPKPQKDK